MKEQVNITKHIISFSESVIEVKMKPTSKRVVILSVVLVLLLSFPLLALSVIAFLKAGYFYAVLFLIISILLICAMIVGSIQARRREVIFQFVIDEFGIKHVDVDATYYILWKDVMSWGYVNHNVISGIRDTPHSLRQTCLYFSKSIHEETYLRKKLNRIDNRRYMHCSTNEMIVFGFQKNDVDENLLKKLNNFVYMHCDKIKQVNYMI